MFGGHRPFGAAYTGDGHLGERVAAFVDGELDLKTRDHVMAHLARCDRCRSEVALQRELKTRLAGLTHPPAPPALLAALHRMAEPGEPAHVAVRAAGARSPQRTVGVCAGSAPRSVGGPRRPHEDSSRGHPARRVRRFAAAGAVAVAATLTTAFAVGGQPTGPVVTPDVNQYVVDHTEVSRVVPFSGLTLPGVPADGGVAYQPVGTKAKAKR
jgi:anti-sigma factor RsiW